MRENIDQAIRQSMTSKQFGAALRAMGYQLNFDPNRKHHTIKMPGAAHPTRLKTLGENYTEDAINRRILANFKRQLIKPQPEIQRKFFRLKGLKG